ncbi:hypothetical protein HLBENOHH_00420 [Aeromonas dhakensis]|uniref:phosphoribosyltransferase family protein n=1 Tax=Aeromonas TaxID=642 RepID=UPI001C22432A|nr:phosphoribosyltransferase family protein [Aeromonas sp. FDAARGOS 1414]QWZ80260.1 hypothetical protein I6L44_14215 [Aeromonas sp. FDAARGOS 1414]
MGLKGIILSIEDTILNKGTINTDVYNEVSKLFSYLKLRRITPVILSNQKWTLTGKDPSQTRCLFEYLQESFPELVIFSRHRDNSIPAKPTAESTKYVIDSMGWKANEVVYLGSTDTDMRTAVNGNLLFLRATWFQHRTDYGFEFISPKEVARFIDTLCLREHYWSHIINSNDFRYYALAPFSTMKAEFKRYSEDARAAAKYGSGTVDFWLGALVTSLYFSNIHAEIDYVCPYPGHKTGVDNDKMSADLLTFSKCFRKTYIHDLIQRYSDAMKSQTARQRGVAIDHLNQINTIHLNKYPTRNYRTKYKAPPLSRGKTVLVVDDICTKGYSLTAAKGFIESTGAKVILVSWLKTINTDIVDILPLRNIKGFNPYTPNNIGVVQLGKTYGYHKYLVDDNASEELGEQFEEYLSWNWPKGID